jgi:hypothetical protein
MKGIAVWLEHTLGLSPLIVVWVAIAHLAVVGVELANLSTCRPDTSACWPYFFVFLADLPVSIGISQILAPLTNALSATHFWMAATLTLVIFEIVGTVWWVLVMAGALGVWRWVFRRRR